MASWSSSAVAPPRTDTPTGPVAAPTFAALRYEVSEQVATITLDRPDALNSLTVPLKRDLFDAFKTAARDPDVRVVVLTGSGRAFCAGQDLRERLEPDAAPLAVEVRERYNPIVRAMVELDKPIVGVINGVAAGAGASLAFACDIRIAAEGATFVLGFGRVGLVPDSGATWLLPRLIGASKATELALTNDPLSAVDAERLGLVAKVVPADELAAASRQLAARLAAGAPRALALTKRAMRRALESSLEETLEYEADLQGVAGRSRDHGEGIAAFIEKRSPRFEGE
jgi:2-(1,2-epoxy-1,2-dihydrophenyl)acetyl-CoA isomerase